MQPQLSAIVGTKLLIPRGRQGVVPRPRLTQRLDAGLDGGVTVISAPAGFGKTTLLASWLRGKQREDVGVAWLALEPADSDPARFLRYLVGALRSLAPAIGDEVLPLLETPAAASPISLLPALVNDLLATPRSLVLVLDDYHVLESRPVHEAVNFLVDHLPPQLHLVVAGREDPPLPLARLRARGQLCELRAADLRFTAEEAAAFLRDTMGLALAPEQVAAIETRTEGWVAGLQMAALSMRDRSDVSGFVGAFAASNRYILDYLLEEVLNRLPAQTQRFLLRTSILDRLSGSLCDALLDDQEPGSAAEAKRPGSQQMLEQIERANLFLTPLDAERRWYRYHQLFADLLRSRLQADDPACLKELHGRAAAWHAANGMIHEAIEHALAGDDFQRAARLIEITFARMAHAPRELATVLRWFAALPAEVVRSRVRLSVDYAGALIAAGRLDDGEQSLRAAEEALRQDATVAADAGERDALELLVAAAATLLASQRGDLPRAVESARRALALPPSADPAWRTVTLVYLAEAYQAADDLVSAGETLIAAEELSRGAGDDMQALTVLAGLARVQKARGNLGAAAATLRRMLQLPALRATPYIGGGLVGLGQILAERNELDEALDHLTRGLDLLKPVAGLRTNIVDGFADLARVRRARGELEEAHAAVLHAEEIAARSSRPAMAASAERARVLHMLAAGDIEAAGHWADRARAGTARLPAHLREAATLAAMRVRLAQGRLEEALETLTVLRSRAEAAGRVGSLIEILVLLALAHARRDDTSRAVQTVAEALAAAEQEGYARIFLDEGEPMLLLLEQAWQRGGAGRYARALLARARPGPGRPASSAATAQAPRLVEPLTGRERDVLRLLGAGLSGPEIAGALVMTQNTVKTHLKNLYGKLDAHTRDQALSRARELGLL